MQVKTKLKNRRSKQNNTNAGSHYKTLSHCMVGDWGLSDIPPSSENKQKESILASPGEVKHWKSTA